MWPMDVTCGNLCMGSMTKLNGSVVTGFCPYPAYDSLELHELLQQHGGMGDRKKGKREKAITLIGMHNEQSFLDHLISCINEVQERGPILIQVGTGERALPPIPCVPVLSFFATDNEGGNKVLCCGSCTGRRPCRLCKTTRSEIYKPGSTTKTPQKKYVCVYIKSVCALPKTVYIKNCMYLV